ncbi:MAG: hypothetical protein J0L84_02495, partial [Verrucomicrobia bacterium]|nr:hypothetical protein [Verrucomicrobiota bacterium]
AHPAASALRFNGLNDFVLLGDPATPFPAGDLTVEFWMRSTNVVNRGSMLSYAIPGQDNEFLIYDCRSFQIHVLGSSVPARVGAVSGTWRHVAIARSVADGMTRVYLDGALAAEVVIRPGEGFRQGGYLVAGQDQDNLVGGFDRNEAFDGELDDLRIWNQVRTPAQIADGRFVRPTGLEPGLVAAWNFDASAQELPNQVAGGHPALPGNRQLDQAPDQVPGHAPFDAVYVTAEDTAIPVSLAGTDADGDTLSARVTSLPRHGSLFDTADGTTPAAPLGGGRARSFDGTDDLIVIAENPAGNLSAGTRWTIAAWIRPMSVNNTYPVIYSEGHWRLSLGLQTGTGRLDSWVNDASQITSERAVTLGEWQHVAVTSDGLVRTFYINGQPAGTGSAPEVMPDATGAAIGGTISEPGGSRNRFHGEMDDVGLWNRALGPEEVASLARRPLNGSEPGLIAWWPLDEPQGNVIGDRSGGASQGVAGGGVASRAPSHAVNTSPPFAAQVPRVADSGRRLVYVPEE